MSQNHTKVCVPCCLWTPWSCFLSAPGDILNSEIFLLLEIHLNLYKGHNSWNIWSFEESLLTGQEKFSILRRKYKLLTPFMTMHVLRRNQASADFLTECENGHFLSIEPIGINSQSLEDTQVRYISQKYTLDNYTLEKYTLALKALWWWRPPWWWWGGHQRQLLHTNVQGQWKFKSMTNLRTDWHG